MIKIAVTGPESTGKTTLAKSLAKHFKVGWVKEYARDYLNQKDGEYSIEDLDEIALGQRASIESMQSEIVIADTEMTVVKVWSEFKYGECSDFINELWALQKFDLYLICSPDIPFEPDPLREHEEFRDELFVIYQNVLKQKDANFVVISGDKETRLNQAITEIKKIL